jgi:hypothetical protein
MNNYDLYKKAISETASAIKNLAPQSDSGSCNLDTVVIDFRGWHNKTIRQLSVDCGVYITQKLTGSWGGFCQVMFDAPGMAAARTAAVEFAQKHLEGYGIKCYVWYHTD